MKKKILLSVVALVAVVAGVAGFSAYEAHVINVTAKIENALSVSHDHIMFGTVFPQEKLYEDISIVLSQSFLDEDRVDDVNYFIRQKPKPRPEAVDLYFNGDVVTARHWCYENWNSEAVLDYPYFEVCYYNLCPYLSKHSEDENDGDLDAFHEMGVDVFGHLAKSEQDIEDIWTIDLDVPCFEGQCAQDWTHFGWELPAGMESEVFGCDLWVEVFEISLPTNGICETEPDVMLVLDRSGSIDSSELITLQNAAYAFVTALDPKSDGAHMGQTSFADFGSLDLHLTDNITDINNAIGGLVNIGYTNLYEGILLADQELDDGIHDRLDSESPDFMVIITDGNPNRPLSGDPEALAIGAATAAKAAGVTIYVVGVGTDVDADWLKNNIASSPNHYFGAANFSQLQIILEALAVCEDPAEQGCIDSGGTVSTSMCCLATGDFPNNCATGACGCALIDSHEVKTCVCPSGTCFNGTECVVFP